MGKDLDKFRGCLIGGAAGDALGYAVELMSAEEIFIKYGENGITDFVLQDDRALISDDTQMTLFTACGLLCGTTMQQTGGTFESYPASIALACRDWLRTQLSPGAKGSVSWLNNVPEMNCRRGPGNTCLSALSSGVCGSIAAPVNDKKGCGGVMRVAPVGLYLQSLGLSLYDADLVAAEAAAVTHGHPLGYMPAAALAQIIGYAVNMPGSPLLYSVMSAKHALGRLFPDEPQLAVMTSLIDKAIELSLMDLDDLDAIRQLGLGRTGEECLAIAVYCALKYSDDFESALIAAVNHDGDSDSTGAVTGNILGAYLGMNAIPAKFTEKLELRDIILEMADDLYNDCPISFDDVMADRIWVSKYIRHDYVPGQSVETAKAEAGSVTEAEFTAVTEVEEAEYTDVQMEMDLNLFVPAAEEQAEPEAETVEIDPEQPGKQEGRRKSTRTSRPKPKEEKEPKSRPLILQKAKRKSEQTSPQENAPKGEAASEAAKSHESKKVQPEAQKKNTVTKKDHPEATKKPAAPKQEQPEMQKNNSCSKKEHAEVLKKPAATKMDQPEVQKQSHPETPKPVVRPSEPGNAKFYRWNDASFGGYDVLMVCDKNAYLNLCADFEGCRLDALCENGRYYFLIDSSWEEFTPLRRSEFLHPGGSGSPMGEAIRKFKFTSKDYSFRVYTDKELR